jgi:hypothetical protein
VPVCATEDVARGGRARPPQRVQPPRRSGVRRPSLAATACTAYTRGVRH